MSKRLILIVAFAFIFSITAVAFAEVQNIKISGDITLTGILRGDWTLRNDQAGVYSDEDSSSDPQLWNNDKQQYFLSQTRVRIDADLTDNVSATVRLLNERTWGDTRIWAAHGEGGESDYYIGENDDEVLLDLAYVTLREFLYSPLTLTAGRQEIKFGSGMIVADPDTNIAATGWGGTAGVVMSATTPIPWFYMPAADLSLRKAFDAIRATLDYDPLVIDGIYAKIEERNPAEDDDTTLFGVNLAYDFRDAMKTMGELYYFAQYRGRNMNTTNKKVDRVNTIGARVTMEPIERLTTQLEAAFQCGTYDPSLDPNSLATDPVQRRRAWAVQGMASYELNMKYNPVITGVVAAFSGEHDNAAAGTKNKDTYQGWDPMFEGQSFGRITNALIEQSNQIILGGGVRIEPMEDVTLGLDMYNYWLQAEFADRETTILNGLSGGYVYMMSDDRYLGKEFDLSVIYDYTEDVQFGLCADWFIPGKAFNSDYNNSATQLIGSMKVTF
jgi:hypothetical protein